MGVMPYVDQMMLRALDLSEQRERLDADIRSENFLVGGIAPRNLRRGERLRAADLLFIADARESLDRYRKGRG